MKPIYIPNFINSWFFMQQLTIEQLLEEIPWVDKTETRRECFMSDGGGITYTYGKGRGVRSYTSVDYTKSVRLVLPEVNRILATYGWNEMNGCFLNCYSDDKNHLGWHADNFDRMDHTCPVVSVSIGEQREIWWRKFGETGEVPETQKQLLASGSMFIMPPGMQQTYEHRIPKGSHPMDTRISMTFRRFLID